MTSSFDPGDDFNLVADNTQAVTLLRRGATSGAAGLSVQHALRRAVQTGEFAAKNRDESRRYINSGGHCVAADAVWHLPSAELAAPPGIGDVILDSDGRRWTILELELILLGTLWKCTTRDLQIAYGLDDTIDILKAEYSKTDAGAAEQNWQTWRTGIRARIQPLEIKIESGHSAAGSEASYRIFVQDDLSLDHTHRIRGADGSQYRITAVTGAERLGELQTIETVKI